MADKFPHEHQGKPMHFFKIITAPSLQDGKLMIPNKFVDKYGEGLPNTLFLKHPNGAEWKLSLEKRDGKIWFQKGWKEFAEYHSLAHGHLVLFRYQRTSHFQVQIFDSSALEIEYPLENVQGKMASNDEENKPLKDEKLKYYRSGQKRKDNSSLEFLQPRMGSRKCVKVDNTMKLQKVAPHHTDRKCKGKLMTTVKQVTTFDRASCFRPCNPSFIVVMYPSYVCSRGPLYFPSKFCKRHIDLHKKRGDINLQVLNGWVWAARYVIRQVGEKLRFEVLSGGWKAFAEYNNLKVGDVCTFELIPGTKLTFQVHIFRESDNSNCSTSQGKLMTTSTTKQVTAFDKASCFRPCNPSFLIVIQPSYVGSWNFLNFPIMFCKSHIDLHKERGDINLQVLNDRVWLSRYRIRTVSTRKIFELSSGWKTFAEDNNLKVGDVCTFELIHGTKLTFQVHIFRESDNSNCSTKDSGQMIAACQRQRKEMKIVTATKSSPPKNFGSFV